MIRTSLINGVINLDSDFSKYIESLSNPWVIEGFNVQDWVVKPWKARVKAERTNGETIYCYVESTEDVSLSWNDGKVYIVIDQEDIDSGLVSEDGLNIARIEEGEVRPVKNFLKIWSKTWAMIKDERDIIKKINEIEEIIDSNFEDLDTREKADREEIDYLATQITTVWETRYKKCIAWEDIQQGNFCYIKDDWVNNDSMIWFDWRDDFYMEVIWTWNTSDHITVVLSKEWWNTWSALEYDFCDENYNVIESWSVAWIDVPFIRDNFDLYFQNDIETVKGQKYFLKFHTEYVSWNMFIFNRIWAFATNWELAFFWDCVFEKTFTWGGTFSIKTYYRDSSSRSLSSTFSIVRSDSTSSPYTTTLTSKSGSTTVQTVSFTKTTNTYFKISCIGNSLYYWYRLDWDLQWTGLWSSTYNQQSYLKAETDGGDCYWNQINSQVKIVPNLYTYISKVWNTYSLMKAWTWTWTWYIYLNWTFLEATIGGDIRSWSNYLYYVRVEKWDKSIEVWREHVSSSNIHVYYKIDWTKTTLSNSSLQYRIDLENKRIYYYYNSDWVGVDIETDMEDFDRVYIYWYLYGQQYSYKLTYDITTNWKIFNNIQLSSGSFCRYKAMVQNLSENKEIKEILVSNLNYNQWEDAVFETWWKSNLFTNPDSTYYIQDDWTISTTTNTDYELWITDQLGNFEYRPKVVYIYVKSVRSKTGTLSRKVYQKWLSLASMNTSLETAYYQRQTWIHTKTASGDPTTDIIYYE